MVEVPIGRPSLPSVPTSFARGAFLYAGLLFLSAIPALLVTPFVGIPLLLGSLGVLYVYRDPSRQPPPGGIVAPADGTVASVEWEDEDEDGADPGNGSDEVERDGDDDADRTGDGENRTGDDGENRTGDEANGRIRLGIYLSVRDVHVIRAPFGGEVRAVDRESGGHWPAPLPQSSGNEKVHVRFDGAEVTMVVGWFARRIRPYVVGGQRIRRGGKLGHIAFGSRTEVLLPRGIEPEDLEVEPGERVRAGETVIVEADAYDREVHEALEAGKTEA